MTFNNRKSVGVSRRDLLKGMGAGAAAAALGSAVAIGGQRAAAQSSADVRAFLRFMFGDLELTIIQDTGLQIPATNFAVNASEADVNAALEANNHPTGAQNATVDVTLIRTGSTVALMDSGVGSAFGAPQSLMPTLALLGVAAEDITNVIITHFHIDHLAGIINNGARAFPNATIHMAQTEYDFLTSAVGLPNAVQQNINNALAQLQPTVDADALVLYASEEELLPGISTTAAPGHSPGHHAIMLSSGGRTYLNLADTATHPLISLYNPDWHFTFDADPMLAAESRRTLLQRAVDEDMIVFGYHFPFPGIGIVDTDGDGFRFIPYAVS